MSAIECVAFRPYDKGFFKGFATLYIEKWGVEIDGFTLWKKENRTWVKFPSDEYEDKQTGEKKYRSKIRFRNKDHFTLFVKEAKEAVDAYIAKMSQDNEVFQDIQPNNEEPVPF